MSSALTVQAPQTVADTTERKRLFMSLIVKGGTSDQIALALGICDRYGFDPLLKHVVLISGQVYVTRDGLLHHAHQTKQLAGIEEREAVREADGKWRVTVAVFRKGYERAFVATAFQVEHENTASPVWQKAPYRMTVKCATVAALRLAFDISLGAAEEIGYDNQGVRTNIGEARFIEPTASGPRLVETIEVPAEATGMAAPDFADYVKAIKAMDTDGVAGKEIVAFIKEHDDGCDEEQHAQVRRVWTVIVERRKAVVAARQAEAAPAPVADDDPPWEAVVGQPAQPPAATNGADQPITEAQRLAIRSLGRQRGVDERQILPTVQGLLPEVMITDIAQVKRGQINQVLDGLRRLPLPESQAAAVALGGQA